MELRWRPVLASLPRTGDAPARPARRERSGKAGPGLARDLGRGAECLPLSTASRARGARRAPDWAPILVSAPRRNALTETWRNSRPSPGRPLGERCAPGCRLPLFGPPGHGGVGARPVPAPTARAQRRNESAQARELQERAILRRSSVPGAAPRVWLGPLAWSCRRLSVGSASRRGHTRARPHPCTGFSRRPSRSRPRRAHGAGHSSRT